ncbi:MAG: phosphoribosylformylglycinamidine synthase subunit PurS, partial [Candidatus Omnitrophica bacterium]|nr:phosphoribosylformylglycinamidine synthase subunit PurS [Candidatus Omnitrophota bacterium]
MIWRVEIKNKKGIFDAVGEGIKKDILDLNIKGVEAVNVMDVYVLEGKITASEIKHICENLLADPITQEYKYDGSDTPSPSASAKASADRQPSPQRGEGDTRGEQVSVVEVCYRPGVMDPVEESTKKGVRDMGVRGINSVKTAKKYLIKGALSQPQVSLIAEKLLYNKVIQHICDARREKADLKIEKGEVAPYKFRLVTVDMLDYDDEALIRLSRRGQLFLNLNEMRTIRDYFKSLGRPPTDCELETLAQTWSEHCKHKTFRGMVEYKEEINPRPEDHGAR